MFRFAPLRYPRHFTSSYRHRSSPRRPVVYMSTEYLFTGTEDGMDLTVFEIEGLPVNDPSRKTFMVGKRLVNYGKLCTSSIIVSAANECKVLSEECESDFDPSDILDPDFPETMDDDDDASEKRHVGDYLADMAECRVEEVVATMHSMQRSWSKRKTVMNLRQYKIAKKLWELGSSLGEHRLQENYGPLMSEEFSRIGCDLFS